MEKPEHSLQNKSALVFTLDGTNFFSFACAKFVPTTIAKKLLIENRQKRLWRNEKRKRRR